MGTLRVWGVWAKRVWWGVCTCVLLVSLVGLATPGWRLYVWVSPRLVTASAGGAMFLGWDYGPDPVPFARGDARVQLFRMTGPGWGQWWPALDDLPRAKGSGTYMLALPFWMLAAGSAGVLAVPVYRRVRRRAAEGACVHCGYDRRGIAEGAACPECGEV